MISSTLRTKETLQRYGLDDRSSLTTGGTSLINVILSRDFWVNVETLLMELSNKYAGRELVVKIEWEFEDSSDNAEQSKTGSSASANMARALDQELEINKGESCSLFAQINAI
jgi:hypothetical protein